MHNPEKNDVLMKRKRNETGLNQLKRLKEWKQSKRQPGNKTKNKKN